MRSASTADKAPSSAATASRGSFTPSSSACRSAASGNRSASAPRSTTSPTTAHGSCGSRRIPTPRTSISPASASAGRTSKRPHAPCRSTRSSPTSLANSKKPARAASMSSSASRDFPGTGRAANQHRARPDQDGRGVHRRVSCRHHVAGRCTMKRAPITFGVASGAELAGAAIRFSTQMAPPCASTICLEIDSPRPEFWPNPWCGRSV